jgi:hypothetical protein
MFNIKQLLEDHSIEYFSEGKNTKHGWITIQCPCCDDHSNHGGFNLTTSHYVCWRCGHHWQDEIISLLLNISRREAKTILEQYEGENIVQEEKKEIIRSLTTHLPKNVKALSPQHIKYLRDRNFDPERTARTWHLKGTDFMGKYKFRIIIPIMLNNKLVSYIGRDITGKHPLRYKACEEKYEVNHYKHILFGSDHIRNRRAIICEGPFDVFRLGHAAVATFGTGFTKEQILFISKVMDTAFILYDKDAIEQATKLYHALNGLIDKVEILTLPDYAKDPAELTEDDVKYLKKELDI